MIATTTKSTITLTKHQQAAYDLITQFVQSPTAALMTLVGYAGTGKTTLVGKLVDELQSQGLRVALAAPSNKAVRVLEQKVGCKASGVAFASIHSFLGLRLVENDSEASCRKEGRATLSEYDLTIVDESSMLGDDLYTEILTSKGRCKVLFVGDPAQLPPVKSLPGTISPVFTKVQMRAMLSEVVRQAADNPIIKTSMLIRQAIENKARIGIDAIRSSFPPAPASACVMHGDIDACVQVALYEISEGRDARVITYANRDVQFINMKIHEGIHGKTTLPFVVGEKAMEQKGIQPSGNNPGLINSEEVTILSIEPAVHKYCPDIPAAKVIVAKDDGKEAELTIALDDYARDALIKATWHARKQAQQAAENTVKPEDRRHLLEEADRLKHRALNLMHTFANLRHVYALTAHKSQGSTFDTAIVHFPGVNKVRDDVEFNQMLYVAITRPSQYLAVVI